MKKSDGKIDINLSLSIIFSNFARFYCMLRVVYVRVSKQKHVKLKVSGQVSGQHTEQVSTPVQKLLFAIDDNQLTISALQSIICRRNWESRKIRKTKKYTM